ncbi:MAG: ATP-binding protein [Pseudomonadota bacterium]
MLTALLGTQGSLQTAFLALGGGLVLTGLLAGVLRHAGAPMDLRLMLSCRAMIRSAEHPAALTDLSGEILASNQLFKLLGGAQTRIEASLGGLFDDPTDAAQLARRALALGGASEVRRRGATEAVSVAVAPIGATGLEWRVLPCTRPPLDADSYDGAPFLRVELSADGTIQGVNRAIETADGAAVRTLSGLVADLPLRPGGVHAMHAGPDARMRCLLAPREDGRSDAFFFPVDPAELQDAGPDRFLDHLPIGLVRMTASGKLIFANRAAKALLGERAEPDAMIGALVEGLARSIPERLAEVARGIGTSRAEIARSIGDERELFLQVALNRLVLDGDIQVLAVVSDATEMKTLEAQFVQSQKMLAVGQLAGGVAHDFNNLLTAINGHCDLLLLRHESGDSDHGDLMQIRQNANRAAALVRQLLAFSRKQTLRPKTLLLIETLSELSHLLNRLMGERVELKIDNGADLWPVRVDERQFEQVIMNLVVNARDAMPNGGRVEIRTRNTTIDAPIERDSATVPAGDYVLVDVLDTGIGIPEDRLRKIFEPFFTTKKVGEGTGLGLSTVYGIVKQTGGFIFASSVVGQGSTFTIYLPRHSEEMPAAQEAPPTIEGPRDLTGQGVVLLAEDEAPVRSFAARALRLRGYTVLEAASGEEALEIVDTGEHKIDILVSDVVMPGIDGPTWVAQARATLGAVKVIFVSGYAEDVFRSGDAEVPDAVFVAKPFSLNELTQRVKEALEAG